MGCQPKRETKRGWCVLWRWCVWHPGRARRRRAPGQRTGGASRVSGAETFRVSRVRPSHLTPPLHVRGNWRDMALLLPLRCPLRRWLARLLLRLLLHRYQCQLYQELVACDVFVAEWYWSVRHSAFHPMCGQGVQDAAWEIAGFGVTFKRMHQSNRNKVPQPKNPVHSVRVPRGTAP